MLQLSLRPVLEEDLPFLRKLFESTQPDLAALESQLRESLLDMQFRSRKAQWAEQYPNAEYRIIECEGSTIGWIAIEESEEIHLIDIALLEESRGKGFGTAALQDLIAKGKAVTLEVRIDNPAVRLYRRLGFRVVDEHGLHYKMRKEFRLPETE